MTLKVWIDGDEVTLKGTIKGDETHKQLTPRPWVWSRRESGYVLPRSMRPETRAGHLQMLRNAAERLGVALEEEDTGVVLSEADIRERRAERLEQRADRHEAIAHRSAAASAAAGAAADRISDGIPFGQPILVGHHSERRARRDIERMHSLTQKYLEEGRTAERAAFLAAAIRNRLDNPERPVTIRRRITRNAAEARKLERSLANDSGKHPDWTERVTGTLERLREGIDIDRATLIEREAAGEFVTYSKANVVKGGIVTVHGLGRFPVVRVNATSVTVPSIVGGSWTDTIPYDDVIGYEEPSNG